MIGIKKSVVAEEIPFDNDSNGFVAEDVQAAIEEAALSGSGGDTVVNFSFGRSGSVNNNTWLRRTGQSPSNRSGMTVALNTAVIEKVAYSNRDNDTGTITIYQHDGNLNGLTVIGSVNVVNTRTDSFTVNFPVTTDRQIAVRVTSGRFRDLGIDLKITGTV